MEKPIQLREETWRFLRDALDAVPPRDRPVLLRRLGYGRVRGGSCLAAVAERPGAFLVFAGILRAPRLLGRTVVADAEGLEFVIGPPAAETLARREDVCLRRLYDGRPCPFAADEVQAMIRENGVFDQLA